MTGKTGSSNFRPPCWTASSLISTSTRIQGRNMARGLKRCWRIFRVCFRGVRMAILFALLLVVVFLAWVNTIGVPDFVKRRMITELHQRGLDVQFSRMRWRFERGLVADNVTIGSAKQETNSNNPRFSMRQLAIGINHRELMHARVKVDSVEVSKGRLFWPLGETNGEPLWLTVTNIQTQLR